jgi:outer membrane protein assembly factor BamB
MDGTIFITSGPSLYAIHPDSTLAWKYTCNADLNNSPIIDQEGTIYSGTSYNVLHAVLPNGSLKWTYQMPYIRGVTAGADGWLYVTTASGLEAVDQQGHGCWQLALAGGANINSVMSDDGILYIMSAGDHVLHAVDTLSGGPAAGQWPTFQNDSAHTGRRH